MTIKDPHKIISPFSNDSAWVKTTITFEENLDIKLLGSLIETPESKEEFDPMMQKMVKFNRGVVTFSQTIKIVTNNKFASKGNIEFMAITDKYALPPELINFKLNFDKTILTIKTE